MTPTVPAYKFPTITSYKRHAEPYSEYRAMLRLQEHQQEREREKKREEAFSAGLQSCVPQPMALLVRAVWDKIKGCVPGVVRVPHLDVREEGGVLLSWDQGVHHLDVEVLPDTSLDFFYLNRETNEAWDVETTLHEQERLPEKVLQHFNHFRLVV